MNNKLKRFLPLLMPFFLTLSSGLLISFALPTQLGAKSVSASQNQILHSQLPVSVTFEPPEGGQPSTSAGGASRGNCPQDATAAPALTAVLPAKYQAITAAGHPTFFVYVPQTSARQVFFSLKDENNKDVYEARLPITGESGIVSVKLPTESPELETGKSYKWYFVVMCGNALRPGSPVVEGQVKRVENQALSSQLDGVSPIERAALYGKNGYWYDTLASIAEARRSQPEEPSYKAAWEQVLTSVGLDAIATKLLLN